MKRNKFLLLLLLFLCGCGSGENNAEGGAYIGGFYASKQSDIYHYPSCPSAKQIYPNNLLVFDSVDLAVTNEYRPCKICNPPLGRVTNFAPILTLVSISPTDITQYQGGGQVEIRYFIDTHDENGDLNSVHYDVTKEGALVSSDTFYTGNLGKNVSMRPSFYLSTATKGTYTVAIYGTDLGQNKSNVVTASVTVR